jgi:dCMP deaminase
MGTRITWEQYGLNLAYAAATRSEDPYHRVGCALLRADHSVASVGYNGAPSGVSIDWGNRDARRAQVVHAETNALRWVRPGEVELMAVTMMPCQICVLAASAFGIRRVVYFEELDPTVYDIDTIRALAERCGVTLVKESE